MLLAGIGVFFRIPQVMPEIEKISYFTSALVFIRFCFYLMGVLLIAGGIKKLYRNFSKVPSKVVLEKESGGKGV